jgi:hypothetical protein
VVPHWTHVLRSLALESLVLTKEELRKIIPLCLRLEGRPLSLREIKEKLHYSGNIGFLLFTLAEEEKLVLVHDTNGLRAGSSYDVFRD